MLYMCLCHIFDNSEILLNLHRYICIVMKRTFLLFFCILSISALYAQPAGENVLNLKIGTYNIWSEVARKGQIKKQNAAVTRSWEASRESVAELIVDLDCDIIAMQEVTVPCRDDLKKLVRKAGGRYGLWWINTYPETHKTPVGNAVFYKKKEFSFDQQRILYFSPTPEVMSQGWDEGKYYRAALTAVVTHKKTGRKFFFIATHGPLRPEASANAGRILVEIDKKYNVEGLPSIVVGDMNAAPDKPFYSTMCSYYEDAYVVAEKRCGTVGTFNSSGEREENFVNPDRRIDHIYVHSTENGTMTVEYYEVNKDKYLINGAWHYPSDHNPVVADILFR